MFAKSGEAPSATVIRGIGERMLTRKMLKAMSIEEDAIEQIIEAHTETVDALKEQRDGYKADAEKASSLSDELEKVRRQLKEAQSSDEYDELESKYSAEHKELEDLRQANQSLQSEFDAYKEQTEAKETERQKSEAYRKLLEDAGIAPKYVGSVLGVAKLSDFELDEDGTIKGADKLTEKVKADFPEFVARQETSGAGTENPPETTKTKSDVSPIAQRIIDSHYQKKYGKSEE